MIDGVYFVPIRKPGKPVQWYVYAWRGGPRILKATGPNKPKLGRAQIAAIAAAQAEQGKPDLTKLESLIRELRITNGGAPEWKALAASTRSLWDPQLDLIEAKWGETPLNLWSDSRMVAKVVAWRDGRAETPRAADIGVQVLSFLLGFGRLRGSVSINVAAGVPTIYRPHGRAEIIWTAEDLDRFAQGALIVNRPHVLDALWLACLTGLRRADLVNLTWSQVGLQAISRTAQKKSRGKRRRAVVPLIPESRQLLDELRTRERLPGVDHVLVNSLGKPWALASLTQAVAQICRLVGIAEPEDPELNLPARLKHLHDCRGTFVTHLCRHRLTDQEIADITAWSVDSVSSIRRRYVDDAAIVVALAERIGRAF